MLPDEPLLTLSVDTNVVINRPDDPEIQCLHDLAADGWIRLVKTETLDTERIESTDSKLRTERLDETTALPERRGVGRLDHSRYDHAVYGDDDDEERFRHLASLMRPNVEWGSARKQHMRDVMHVDTSIKHDLDGFVTCERAYYRAATSRRVTAAYGGFRICSPSEALTWALEVKSQWDAPPGR